MGLGSFFMLNVFVGVVIDQFKEEKAKMNRTHVMTQQQVTPYLT